MIRFFLLFLAGLLCLAPALAAQNGGGRAAPPVLELPIQDNAALLQRESAARKPGRPHKFAVSLPVSAGPTTDGKWSRLPDGRTRWQLRVRSTGAKSLNLGFRRFHLPAGAELYLATDTRRYGPFTAADNEEHNQFWSPVLAGDELLIELLLSGTDRAGVDLELATVNHDFEGVLSFLSGDCNVDVACGAVDGLPMIDEYRDIIRSVAAYTLNGSSQCTGFLLNNTNQDGRPLFLTAEHCGVDADNAPSLVTYWNYENSTCRTPGAVGSGSEGDGSREVFNGGARLLASYAPTDFTLLELDDPVNPLANVFFAGWSLNPAAPTGGGLTIHHPNVQEKRISFSFDPLSRSNISGTVDAAGKFFRVASWDIGTTEGGSSGAPLFDLDGRVRGQLFGGRASCGNGGDDVFGSLFASWTGGGTPATRLRDWLDPCGSDRQLTDGLEQTDLAVLLTADQACLTRCVSDPATFRLRSGDRFPQGSQLTVTADPRLNLTVPEAVAGGETFDLSYPGLPELAAGSYPITVTITGENLTDVLTLTLTLLDQAPEPVVLTGPAAAATDTDPFANLGWRATPGTLGYGLQLSTSPDFSSRAVDLTDLTDTTFRLRYPLNGGTTYYWRVRARNECGGGAWSAVRSFTTREARCALQQSVSLPVAIPSVDSVRVVAELEVTDPLQLSFLEVTVGIEHSFVGDLYASLISPAGTEIPLFGPLEDGLCPGRDLYLIFSDAAVLTAEEFQLRCEDGEEGQYLAVQPRQLFSTLAGTDVRGTWKLAVTDFVPRDGGRITDFSLRFCAEGADVRDLSVGVASAGIVACSNAGGTALLQLGEGFRQPILAVEAGEQALDNFTYTLDPATNTLAVTFSAWTLVGAGSHELSFLVTDADGSARRAVTTLTVLPLPGVIVPLPAVVDTSTITFRWEASRGAVDYLLEVAEGEDFAEVTAVAATAENTLTLPRGELPELFYWRVVSRNACGSFPGPSRAIVLDTSTAVRAVARQAFLLDVFPNPTGGLVRVSLGGGGPNSVLSAHLYSATGQRARTWSGLRGPHFDLSLASLPPGVYLLRLSGPGGEATRRILLLDR